MSTVADVGAVRVGRQRTPSKQTGRYSTKYIRAGNITVDGLDLDDILEMDFTPEEQLVYKLQPGDIVLAEASGSAAHVGRAAMWQGELEECCFQNTVIRYRPHHATSAYSLILFRYYSLSGTFGRTARGSGILHLGASRFAQMRFPLPPLPEQHRIAAEVEHRVTELRGARSSLESALVNIDQQTKAIIAAAVTGGLLDTEAELELPEYESTSERALRATEDDLSSLEMAPFRDWDLPNGWIWKRVDAAGQVTIGRQRSPKYQEGPYQRPYLRVANVYEDYIDTSDILEMNFTPEEYEIYELRWGDVLLNEGQSPDLVGRPAMYRDEVPGACFQNSLLRFRASPAADPGFALLVFRYYLHAGIFRQAARWTTNIAHLSLRRLAALPFPLPPFQEQQRIVAEAARRLQASASQQVIARSSLAQLPELETELLAQAVQGRLLAQDPADEPAQRATARLGPVPTASIASPRRRVPDSAARDKGVDEMILGEADATSSSGASLLSALRSADRPLTPSELFARAGYNRDSTQDIEHFYLALRGELGRSLRIMEIDGEDHLEVVDDATA